MKHISNTLIIIFMIILTAITLYAIKESIPIIEGDKVIKGTD